MAHKLKQHVCQRVVEHLIKEGCFVTRTPSLASRIQISRDSNSNAELLLPLNAISEISNDFGEQKLRNILPDDVITNIKVSGKNGKQNLVFCLNQQNFLKCILEGHVASNATPRNGKTLVFDFSSPNIAKPFHMGHLRSTIIGNFLCNLHDWLGYNVIRLNYLGDWGTQFGMIKAGLSMLKLSEEKIRERPLGTLYDAYVTANQAAEKDSKVAEEARKYFLSLENGESSDLADWDMYREYTVENLKQTYGRLGVAFNRYEWESNYRASNIKPVIEQLRSAALLEKDEEGRLVGNIGDSKTVPLVKSDGTTLYLTRDIAAAIDRYNAFKFERMFYVVDVSQGKHFESLFEILKRLQLPWADNLKHIPFGRVRGMSSRRGTVVFLSDILDQARNVMMGKQLNSPNTRVGQEGNLDTPDILGVSAVIMADLRHSRMKDYSFNWDAEHSTKGETGVRLQYTHCRLHSLREKSGVLPAKYCNASLLKEPAVMNLVLEISRFDDVIQRAASDLEASVLSVYLFNLCNVVNQAILVLKVKGTGEVGAQRLMLFEAARAVLYRGMSLLGLRPLRYM